MKKITFSILFSSIALFSFATNSWTQKGDVGTSGRKNAVAFSIGNKGYIATGSATGGTFLGDLWEYNQTSGAWTQKANFTGTARFAAVGFAIGNYGYVGTGSDGSAVKSDFYKYDPGGNLWTSITSLPGVPRRSACAFATATKGYVGTGFNNSTPLTDFYEYNPSNNTWTAVASFTGPARYSAVAASVNNKGYVGTGLSSASTFYKDWYEYDPTGNSWTQKTDFGGGFRFEGMAFGLTGKIFAGTGYDNASTQKVDCWEFDPSANSWTQRADVALNTYRRNGAVGFSIGSYGYCATGIGPSGYLKDSWEYTPLVTGVEEFVLKNGNVHVYPNPSNGSITLGYELLKNVPATFVLVDVFGKQVASFALDASSRSVKLEASVLNGGTYLYEVKVEQRTVATGKILIIK
ncbi:MAG: T9SS type A sorting domain-containing protein [Bacteroidetes bacterium]|nr:T9SS type A sorting domain-containing protein [Bacteroidota bacterium]